MADQVYSKLGDVVALVEVFQVELQIRPQRVEEPGPAAVTNLVVFFLKSSCTDRLQEV